MRKLFPILIMVLLCSICAAQNTDDASKYLSNPDAALDDAKNALNAGDYERAKRLATIFNALKNTTQGNGVIKEAESHIHRDSFMNAAREFFLSEKYRDALQAYLSSYELFQEEGVYSSIDKCCDAIVSSNTNVAPDAKLGENLYQLYRDSSVPAGQSLGILQYAALLGNGKAASIAGSQFKDSKNYINAVKYYEIAKAQDINVFGNLGYCYSNLAITDRTKRDEYERSAYVNFLEAANRGESVSQYNLGLVLNNGDGVQKDLYAVRYWFEKSFANGYEIAKEQLDKVNKQITQKQRDSLSRAHNVAGLGVKKQKFYWDDLLLDDSYIGARYTYGKNAPIALALVGNFKSFGGYRVEGGYINSPAVFSHEKIIKGEGDLVKESEKSMFMPTFYLTAAPGLYSRYLALDIGIGAMVSPRKFYSHQTWTISTTTQSTTINGSTDTSTTYEASAGTTISYGDESFSKGKEIVVTSSNYGWIHFMLQPTLALMLPFYDDTYIITAHAGYNYIPDCPQISNWTFGIGFLWNLDY